MQEEVVILPMSQMLGRPFAALVMAGCDEVRLSASPEPPGTWTTAQRAALGLPARSVLEAAARAAWQAALQTPHCDVLWRTGDEAGETLLPSPFVQLLQLELPGASPAEDPRAQRSVEVSPSLRPMPVGSAVPFHTLSQSAYDDLRQCPYRFFAMRMLGLTQADELESEIGKRDFGNWLHEVLKHFHLDLAVRGATDAAQWPDLMDAAAAQATRDMALSDGDFLPYTASWPALRDGYLEWLSEHMAEGMQFASAETAHRQSVGDVALYGRIDRIDTLADGSRVVLDYKTESASKTTARVKDVLEDTQMAFYAALLPDDTLRGMYVNVSEKETKAVEQQDIVFARDALIEGIVSDMRRIAAGAALPALGDGDACTYCKARGLCRKDFWAAP
jgi:ATP-dependent helicase/nuclease subunit B